MSQQYLPTISNLKNRSADAHGEARPDRDIMVNRSHMISTRKISS
ncbi:hypothetical protein QUA86_16005 [Microcoleus sp. F6_B6]